MKLHNCTDYGVESPSAYIPRMLAIVIVSQVAFESSEVSFSSLRSFLSPFVQKRLPDYILSRVKASSLNVIKGEDQRTLR